MRSFTSALVGAAVAAIVVSGSLAIAAIPHSTTKVITGCYLKTSGTLRVIDKQANKTCKTTEIELNRPEFCIMSSKILRGLRDASTQGIYA